jgi:phosphate-selective porin OprO/OprP
MRGRVRRAWIVVVLAALARQGWSDDQAPQQPADLPAEQPQQPVSVDVESDKQETTEESAETDFTLPVRRRIVKDWSVYDLKYLTFKWGIYTIIDAGRAVQSDESEALLEAEHGFKIRDFRFTFSGKIAIERPLTYTMGLMYDGPTNSWFPRETGIQIGIPELWGNIFLGRQKEGISLNKITVGYAVWTMERMPFTDALIPIMADGIKWLGVHPSKHANWNVAFFHNELPKSPSKGVYDNAFVARISILPLRDVDDDRAPLLHLGAAYHWGQYSDDMAQARSRPESFTAGYFLDTGEFPAEQNHILGLEAYFRKASLLMGAEYLFCWNDAPTVGNPFFHGGEAFVAWAPTGEIRPYIDIGGKIGFLQPERSLFERGIGAFELVFHGSYTDFDDQAIDGGRFWRLTPQLNWYLDNMVSLRINYGLGHLDRFGGDAYTHFFQWRVQFQIE